MRVPRSKTALVLVGVVLGVVLGASMATAGHYSVDTNNVRLIVSHTVDPDGLDSGWHTHPGPAIVQVEKGFFKIFQGGCEPTIVGPGETYIETPAQPVRAVAKDAITWTTTLILPQGVPPRTDVATSPC